MKLIDVEWIERQAAKLNLEQLRRLDAWVSDRIRQLEAADDATHEKADSERSAKKRGGNRINVQEYVRCGKEGCKCARGELHGPYTYAYWRDESGRMRSAYVGKELKQ